jgi:hypothetical protein
MVTDPASIARLTAVGEATELPRRSPSRGPPYRKSRVLGRQALGGEDGCHSGGRDRRRRGGARARGRGGELSAMAGHRVEVLPQARLRVRFVDGTAGEVRVSWPSPLQAAPW